MRLWDLIWAQFIYDVTAVYNQTCAHRWGNSKSLSLLSEEVHEAGVSLVEFLLLFLHVLVILRCVVLCWEFEHFYFLSPLKTVHKHISIFFFTKIFRPQVALLGAILVLTFHQPLPWACERLLSRCVWTDRVSGIPRRSEFQPFLWQFSGSSIAYFCTLPENNKTDTTMQLKL